MTKIRCDTIPGRFLFRAEFVGKGICNSLLQSVKNSLGIGLPIAEEASHTDLATKKWRLCLATFLFSQHSNFSINDLHTK